MDQKRGLGRGLWRDEESKDSVALGRVVQSSWSTSIVEILQPTLSKQETGPELIQISNDLKDGNVIQMFTDSQILGQSSFVEADSTLANNLPRSDALLAYAPILQDLISVAASKELTYALVL